MAHSVDSSTKEGFFMAVQDDILVVLQCFQSPFEIFILCAQRLANKRRCAFWHLPETITTSNNWWRGEGIGTCVTTCFCIMFENVGGSSFVMASFVSPTMFSSTTEGSIHEWKSTSTRNTLNYLIFARLFARQSPRDQRTFPGTIQYSFYEKMASFIPSAHYRILASLPSHSVGE